MNGPNTTCCAAVALNNWRQKNVLQLNHSSMVSFSFPAAGLTHSCFALEPKWQKDDRGETSFAAETNEQRLANWGDRCRPQWNSLDQTPKLQISSTSWPTWQISAKSGISQKCFTTNFFNAGCSWADRNFDNNKTSCLWQNDNWKPREQQVFNFVVALSVIAQKPRPLVSQNSVDCTLKSRIAHSCDLGNSSRANVLFRGHMQQLNNTPLLLQLVPCILETNQMMWLFAPGVGWRDPCVCWNRSVCQKLQALQCC